MNITEDDTAEVWRPIPGYENAYDASNLGRVRSRDRVTDRGRKWSGRVLRQPTMKNGYRIVTLWRGGSQKSHLVHRLVLAAFNGWPESGAEGRHLDGDQTNNALANLAWGSHSDNQFDQVAHGMHSNAAKTHCPLGHPYNEMNTYVYPGKPHRMCRTCRTNYQRTYQRNLRAARRTAKENAA
ncbi:NUMOD4 domain-containing protein [Williamsia phyllosphaerae]|uniref:HNH endonuclease n=1 Tax=Williamsia phyllosphaerae TaxID=885042 RepID=A0ABQ1V597_9NOCA|nr:hypothetical protein GCM10007298_38210 [Williamsia phyllosphaerae]